MRQTRKKVACSESHGIWEAGRNGQEADSRTVGE